MKDPRWRDGETRGARNFIGTAEIGFVRGPGLRLGLRAGLRIRFDSAFAGCDVDENVKEDKNCFGTAAVTALRLFIVVYDAAGGGVVVLEGVALLVAMKCRKLLVAVWGWWCTR